MSTEADEVAEDYRLALEDLSSNLRHEISNLTVIARENTEHALTIAEVLQKHILKAAPNKKLSALYVLDSIVKNVGTPYTLYFGRNLFKTFMESYAVVDPPVRRKMEEMLRTWKEPVPGSMDSRPVFSHELVRPIENALMKVRAASMPTQGIIPGRPRSAVPHRDTPTPPGMRVPGMPQQFAGPNGQPFYPPHSTPPGGATAAPYPPPYGAYGAPAAGGVNVETLNNDIQNLIVATKAEFSHRPHDTSVQGRLKALLDLGGIVQRGGLPPDQLELIKNKVTELAAVNARGATPTPTPVPSLPSASVTPSPAAAAPAAPPAAPGAAAAAAPGSGTVTLDKLLGQGALAALMARSSATPQPPSQNTTPNPPLPYANVAIRSPPPPQHAEPPKPAAAPAGGQNPMSLLDQLRLAGLLPSAPAASTPAPPPAPAVQPQVPFIPPNIASILASAKAAAAGPQVNSAHPGLNPATLKQQFHPSLLASLYDDLGPPCTQCGRRFRTDEEGRKKKTAHMDWHFRVHQRTTEAEKRGMHRSWYVDQQDWLNSREVVDADHVTAPEEASARATKEAAEAAKPKYIPVPEPSRGINTVCPICQDRFENKWLDTAQEWVWLDAVLVGNRAFHASCHAEATRDREGTPGRNAAAARRTPEPVLGKRKAEGSISSPKVRSLKTSA